MVRPVEVDGVLAALRAAGEDAWVAGEIVAGAREVILSQEV
jgi:hypothetical protein